MINLSANLSDKFNNKIRSITQRYYYDTISHIPLLYFTQHDELKQIDNILYNRNKTKLSIIKSFIIKHIPTIREENRDIFKTLNNIELDEGYSMIVKLIEIENSNPVTSTQFILFNFRDDSKYILHSTYYLEKVSDFNISRYSNKSHYMLGSMYKLDYESISDYMNLFSDLYLYLELNIQIFEEEFPLVLSLISSLVDKFVLDLKYVKRYFSSIGTRIINRKMLRISKNLFSFLVSNKVSENIPELAVYIFNSLFNNRNIYNKPYTFIIICRVMRLCYNKFNQNNRSGYNNESDKDDRSDLNDKNIKTRLNTYLCLNTERGSMDPVTVYDQIVKMLEEIENIGLEESCQKILDLLLQFYLSIDNSDLTTPAEIVRPSNIWEYLIGRENFSQDVVFFWNLTNYIGYNRDLVLESGSNDSDIYKVSTSISDISEIENMSDENLINVYYDPRFVNVRSIMNEIVNPEFNISEVDLDELNQNKFIITKTDLSENKVEMKLEELNLNELNLGDINLGEINLGEINLNESEQNIEPIKIKSENLSLNETNLNETNLNEMNPNRINLNRINLNYSNIREYIIEELSFPGSFPNFEPLYESGYYLELFGIITNMINISRYNFPSSENIDFRLVEFIRYVIDYVNINDSKLSDIFRNYFTGLLNERSLDLYLDYSK